MQWIDNKIIPPKACTQVRCDFYYPTSFKEEYIKYYGTVIGFIDTSKVRLYYENSYRDTCYIYKYHYVKRLWNN